MKGLVILMSILSILNTQAQENYVQVNADSCCNTSYISMPENFDIGEINTNCESYVLEKEINIHTTTPVRFESEVTVDYTKNLEAKVNFGHKGVVYCDEDSTELFKVGMYEPKQNIKGTTTLYAEYVDKQELLDGIVAREEWKAELEAEKSKTAIENTAYLDSLIEEERAARQKEQEELKKQQETIITDNTISAAMSTNTDTTALQWQGDVSEAVKNTVLNKYSLLSSNMKSDIFNSGYKVTVDATGNLTHGHAGECSLTQGSAENTGNGYIGINGSSTNKANIAVIHECGHWLDCVYGAEKGMSEFYSHCDEFTRIYNEEVGNSGYPSYNTKSREEFFAETFRYMYENPSRVQNNTPQAYEFIRNILNEKNY